MSSKKRSVWALDAHQDQVHDDSLGSHASHLTICVVPISPRAGASRRAGMRARRGYAGDCVASLPLHRRTEAHHDRGDVWLDFGNSQAYLLLRESSSCDHLMVSYDYQARHLHSNQMLWPLDVGKTRT